ncbi:MAG: hypothetical protein EPO20_24045 [Betaproteobacteria bacterium]|nr:MAG: hypothetical protein EPO20_24045 [Betaproteobacteria bacterium]
MSKPETKGDVCGFVPLIHVRPARRFIDAARVKLEKIAYDWDEVDSSMSRSCDDLMHALDYFEAALDDSIAVMNEPADQD